MKKKIFITGIMLALCSTLLASCNRSNPAETDVESLPSSTTIEPEITNSTTSPEPSSSTVVPSTSNVEPSSSTSLEPTYGPNTETNTSSSEPNKTVTQTIIPVTETTESTTPTETSTTVVNSYQVVFDANGGVFADGESTSSYTSYGIVVSVTAPTKEGSDFTGWFKDINGVNPFTFDTKITSDTTIYAGWNVKKFDMTFDANGGAFSDKQTQVTYQMPWGASIAEYEAPSRECYSFTGWYSNKECTQAFDFTQPFTKKTTAYAGWEQTAFKVTFDAAGGTINDKAKEEVIVNIGETCTAPTGIPSKADYEFYGWCYDKNGDSDFDPTKAITADTTIYAVYLEIDVSIKAVNDENLSLVENYISGSFGKEVTSISLENKLELAPNCSYKVYSDENCQNELTTINIEPGTNQFYILVSATTSSKKTKYVLYVVKTSKTNIEYSFNGEIIRTDEVYEGEVYPITFVPEVPGYDFGWWCYDEACNNEITSDDLIVPLDGMTFYAYNEPSTNTPYTVNYFKMGVDGKFPDTPSESVVEHGTTGQYTNATVKDYLEENYISLEHQEVVITGDGQAVVNVYYEHIYYASFHAAIEAMKDSKFITPKAQSDFEIPFVVFAKYYAFNINWDARNIVVEGTEIPLVNFEMIDEKLYAHNRYYLNTEADRVVTLYADISFWDGETEILHEGVEYQFTIPKYVISSLAEYDAAASKANVNVKGIISAVGEWRNNQGYIMVQDISGTGGYYGYQLAMSEYDFNVNCQIGNTVILSGEKSVYQGNREFNNCKLILIPDDPVAVKNTDITEAITSGAGISADLMCQQVYFTNLPVVSVSEVNTKDGTFSIVVGDATDTTKQATIFINKWFNEVNGTRYNAWKNLGIVSGDSISFHGFVSSRTSGLYLEPYETDGITVEYHDYSKELLQALNSKFDLASTISSATEYTLPTLETSGLTELQNYEDFSINWSSNATIVTVSGNTLSIVLPENDTEVTIKLELMDVNSGNPVGSKEYKITVKGAMAQIQTELARLVAKLGTATITEKKQFALEVEEGYTLNVTIEDGKSTITWNDETKRVVADPAETEESVQITLSLTFAGYNASDVVTLVTKKSDNPVTVDGEYTVTWAATESSTEYHRSEYPSIDITSKIGADPNYFSCIVYAGASTNTVHLDTSHIRIYTDSSMKISSKSDENYLLSISKIRFYGTTTSLERVTAKVNDVTLTGTSGKESGDAYLEYTINSESLMVYASAEVNVKKIGVTYNVLNNNISSEDKVNYAMEKIVAAFTETSFDENTEIALSVNSGFTFEVNVEAGKTSVVWNAEAGKLIITPTATLEKVTVVVNITYQEYTGSHSFILSVKIPDAPDGLETGEKTVVLNSTRTSGNSSTVTSFDLSDEFEYDTDLLQMTAYKNSAGNNLYIKKDDFRTYYGTGGNGTSIEIKVKEIIGYTILIKSIEIDWVSGVGTVVVGENSTTVDRDITVDVNAALVTIQNQSIANVQFKFKSITLTYEVIKK